MLEIMHFPEELLDASDFKQPGSAQAGKAEMNMAEKLIGSMSATWSPSAFKDDYHAMLEKVVEEKIKHKGKATPSRSAAKPKTNKVIDLASVLQESIKHAQTRKTPAKKIKNAA
jgi:DNA end-binding protein Ku